MNLTAWLEAEKGRSAALAMHFEVSPAAVSQWKRNGVPLNNMKAVREFTAGAVSLEEMVPEPPFVERVAAELEPTPGRRQAGPDRRESAEKASANAAQCRGAIPCLQHGDIPFGLAGDRRGLVADGDQHLTTTDLIVAPPLERRHG